MLCTLFIECVLIYTMKAGHPNKTYIHTHIHTHVHTHVHTFTHTCTHTFTHTFTYIFYIHADIHTFTHTHTHTCTAQKHIHTYLINTYTHYLHYRRQRASRYEHR